MKLRTGMVVFVVALLSISQSGNVFAQPKPSDDDYEKAAAFFKKAEAHYRVQDYGQALEGYKKAYLLSLEPSLLFNMGQCQRQLGHYEEALKSYKSFVRDSPNHDLVPQAQKLIQEMKDVIKANENVKNSPPVDPIKDPNPSTNPISSTVIDDPATNSITDPNPKEGSKATLFYIGAGGAAAAGLIMGGVALASGSKVKQLQQSGGDINEIESAFGRARAFGVVSDVLFVAAIGVGGIGFLTQQKEKKNKPEMTVSIAPTNISFSVRF